MDLNQQLMKGFELHQQGNLQEAANIYQQIIQIDENNTNALHLLGLIAKKADNYEQAAHLIARALKLNPQFTEAYYNFGLVMNKMDRRQDALASFEQAVKLKPDYKEAAKELWVMKRGNDGKFYSQNGQDEYVYDHFFKDKKGGFFVDIGAYDGVDGSNTLFFEKEMGWSGICIEPSPTQFAKLTSVRNCLCLDVCISDYEGETEFLNVEEGLMMLSGIVDTVSAEAMEAINTKDGQKTEVIKSRVRTLSVILEEQGINHVDFCSIDVEGAEMNVLNDFAKCKAIIECITIENNAKDKVIEGKMTDLGYELVVSLGRDEIYKKK